MKKLLFAAVATLLLSACSKNQHYTIEGSFDLPASYQIGDTVISLPPPAGYVYLCSLDGEPLDSALIEDGKFVFTGIADAKHPYFAYIMSEYAAGMFVVEPGTMEAVVGDPLRVSGTPTNDAIVGLMDRVDEIGISMYEEMQSMQQSTGENLNEDIVTPIYAKYSGMVTDLIDSLYNANTENLVGVYCANVMTVQAQSVEELEQLIAPFSEYVRESELIQQHMTILKENAAAGVLPEDLFPNTAE